MGAELGAGLRGAWGNLLALWAVGKCFLAVGSHGAQQLSLRLAAAKRGPGEAARSEDWRRRGAARGVAGTRRGAGGNAERAWQPGMRHPELLSPRSGRRRAGRVPAPLRFRRGAGTWGEPGSSRACQGVARQIRVRERPSRKKSKEGGRRDCCGSATAARSRIGRLRAGPSRMHCRSHLPGGRAVREGAITRRPASGIEQGQRRGRC